MPTRTTRLSAATAASLCLHLAPGLWLVGASAYEAPIRGSSVAKPLMVHATLVNELVAKPEPKPQPKPRPKPKPKPKPKPEPKPEPAPAPEPEPEPEVARAPPAPEPVRLGDADALLAAAQDEWLITENEFELVESHVDNIVDLIQRHWKRPPGARRHMKVQLVINIAPGGVVTKVDVKHTSGNRAFDRSAVNAVLKIRRFAALQTLPSGIFERHFRTINLLFRPEDLSW